MIRSLYNTTARLAELAAALVPLDAQSKLGRTFAARRGVVARYERWGAASRDTARPLLWLHAPSVGEGLMALPIVERVRAELPNVQLAYTFFSPSAERFAQALGADFTDYLPFDSSASAARIMAALQPTALIFSKLDVWPTVSKHAHDRGVKLGLVSASMPAESHRHGIGALLTRDAYAALDLVGAASEDDAQRLVAAGVHSNRIRVTGDTRYDQAWKRAHDSPKHVELVNGLRNTRPTFVAGSTWPADEAELLPAWERTLQLAQQRLQHQSQQLAQRPRLIIAPHEISDAHLLSVEQWADRHHLLHARLSAPLAPDADVIIVDQMGILADLYALATVAYVGGGFHAAGLHSVVEPAVFHVPTIVGPRHAASRDAVAMENAGGILVGHDAEQLANTLHTLFTDPVTHHRTSAAMAHVVSDELGAVKRTFGIVRDLLGRM